MKILKVIHGYPMRYNAGSEVYSQTLCHGLAKRHEVHVFTREEDSFSPDFQLREEHDADDPRITLHIVNNPRLKDRYQASDIDQKFAEVLDRVQPEIVHVGHLNHLSTSLLREAVRRDIPIVFTLHDYWLMCPRGQFMQMFPQDHTNLWAACDGQEDRKCAVRCYARYFSGDENEREADIAEWTAWIERRMRHVREIVEMVDLFIAPANYLRDRFIRDFKLPEQKTVYLDYGFSTERMTGRSRSSGEPFTFGYIGTHIPAKGIHDLIRAFGEIRGDAKLRIWGRNNGQETQALKNIAAALPADQQKRIEWVSEYKNQNIVHDVFDRCDAIVVPSIWVENSPLVIHEAQQARVPVITANAGGMAEYVHHEVNGLLYEHRSAAALAQQMQRFVDDSTFAKRLGARGYLYSDTGDIPDITDHIDQIEELYQQVIRRQSTSLVSPRPGPWRITFDTNPDLCNLSCVMCEEHSPHSTKQAQRQADGRERRVMPFDLIKKVVADAAPHGLKEIIPSTMGEPLLYEHFDGILGLCEQYEIKLNLTTNGTFPHIGARAWAERIVPLASDVKISWNGATRETHEAIMAGSRWDKSLKDLRTFIAVRDAHAASGGNRCSVTLQLTFLDKNVHELAGMVQMAIDLGMDRVKGHHLWAHFKEIAEQSMRRNANAIERWNEAVRASRQVADSHRQKTGRHIHLDNIFPLEDKATEDLAPGGACPFLGQEAWVSAEGRFDPCCAPDEQRRSLGEFGNLNNTGIMDIWNSPAYAELNTCYRNRHLCMGCNMRKPVGGEL